MAVLTMILKKITDALNYVASVFGVNNRVRPVCSEPEFRGYGGYEQRQSSFGSHYIPAYTREGKENAPREDDSQICRLLKATHIPDEIRQLFPDHYGPLPWVPGSLHNVAVYDKHIRQQLYLAQQSTVMLDPELKDLEWDIEDPTSCSMHHPVPRSRSVPIPAMTALQIR
jgi:hypothetical protein